MSFKRMISVFICSMFLLICFSFINFTKVTAAEGIIKPEFKKISVDKKKVNREDVVRVTVEANDDLSGIDIICVTYKDPSGEIWSSHVLTKDSYGNFSTQMKISPSDDFGVYKVDHILLKDSENKDNYFYVYNSEFYTYNNSKCISIDLNDGYFKVKKINNNNSSNNKRKWTSLLSFLFYIKKRFRFWFCLR